MRPHYITGNEQDNLGYYHRVLRAQWRQPIPIFPDQPWQPARAPEPWDENLRLRERAEEPSEIIFVRPIRNPHLVAGDKPSAAPMQCTAGR